VRARRRAPELAVRALLLLPLVLGVAGCPAPALVRPPETPPTGREPPVRVGIVVDSAQVTVSATVPFDIVTTGGAPVAAGGASETWTFRAVDGRVVGYFGPAPRTPAAHEALLVRPQAGGTVSISGRPYRGAVLIRAATPTSVTAINVVDMEDYLLGVVPAEIPPWEIEAVKAQAVAARTYAVGHMGRREALGFDVFATVQDQVYGGLAREDTLISRAVRETRGEILTHAGQPIMAYYHSTCGGRTAAIEEVWRRSEPIAYLKSESDLDPATGRAYCEISNRYRWTERWTREDLLRTLARTLMDHGGVPADGLTRIDELRLEGQTASGRRERLHVAAHGRHWQIRGDSIRWVLRPESNRILNSTFALALEQAADGGYTAHGGGWGHGIGMCQMGAIGRARAGQDYRRILRTYYRDTQLTRIY
jgi:stage II sporulation protein D